MCEIFFGETSKIFHTYWKHFTHSKRFHTYWSHLGLGVEHADMLGKHKLSDFGLGSRMWMCWGDQKHICLSHFELGSRMRMCWMGKKITHTCLTLGLVRGCGCAGRKKNYTLCLSHLDWVYYTHCTLCLSHLDWSHWVRECACARKK